VGTVNKGDYSVIMRMRKDVRKPTDLKKITLTPTKIALTDMLENLLEQAHSVVDR
jgi:hypothetical protein